MKIKARDVAEVVKGYRRYMKRAVREYLYAKMVAWSMEHLINPGFKIEVNQDVMVVPYNKKFQPKADEWDAQVERIAKWMKSEPSKTITKELMNANFILSIYKHGKNDWRTFWDACIYINVRSDNSESCEVEMVKEEVERPKLTGYCAALSEKKYLTTVN